MNSYKGIDCISRVGTSSFKSSCSCWQLYNWWGSGSTISVGTTMSIGSNKYACKSLS